MINNNSELLVDKYGRKGHLTNIGEYYFFKPIELNDNNTSFFEISRPLDFKPKYVLLDESNKKFSTSNIFESQNTDSNIIDPNVSKGEKIFREIEQDFKLILEYEKKNSVDRGDDNWLKHCGIAIKKFKSWYPSYSKQVYALIAEHLIDTLPFDKKYLLLNYIYSIEYIQDENTLLFKIKDSFDNMKLVFNNTSALIFHDKNERKVLIFKKNKWHTAEPEDINDLQKSGVIKKISISNDNLNDIIGYIAYENTNKYLVFKTKNIFAKRNTGARCDESGKTKSIETFNKIFGEEKFTKENTKIIRDNKNNIIQYAITQYELCILQELILRYYDKIKKDKKRWFFNSEEVVLYNI